jgi:hypothetical protein
MERAAKSLVTAIVVALFTTVGASAAAAGSGPYSGGKVAAFKGGKLAAFQGGKAPAKKKVPAKAKPKSKTKAKAKAKQHSRKVTSEVLPANGSFEGSLNGWAGYSAGLSLVKPAPDGSSAARVSSKSGVTSFSIFPTPAPVRSSVAGTIYNATGWVRSDTPGHTVCLRVREWNGDALAGSAQACTSSTSDWKRFPALTYKVAGNGRAVDVYAFEYQSAPNDSFDVDAISLGGNAELATPPPVSPPPPPPASTGALSATAVDSSHIRLDWGAVAGATSYRVLRNDLTVGTSSGGTFTDTLLWPATRYSYSLVALAADGSAVKTLTASAATALLPTSGFPRPFPAGSVWNTPVGNAAVDPRNAGLSAYLASHAKNPNLTLHSWGVSVAESHPSDQTHSVPCVRFPRCTLDAFGSFAIPVTAQPDPSGDRHLAVYDNASQREWDFWQGSNAGGVWTAGAGAAVSMSGNGTAPSHTESGNAANFPLLGGIIRPEEMAQGHIDHALVFMMPGVSSVGHVCPATHNDGDSTDPNALLEGMRIQLDPSVNIDSLGLPAWQKTIARALQNYGAYLRDNSGSLAILAEDSVSRGYDAWATAGLPSGNPSIAGLPWDKFRVLASQTGC